MLIIALWTAALAGHPTAVPNEPQLPQEEPPSDESKQRPCGVPVPNECFADPTERCSFVCPESSEPDGSKDSTVPVFVPQQRPCGIPLMDGCQPHPTERCGMVCPGELLHDYGANPTYPRDWRNGETTEVYRDSRNGLPACAMPMPLQCQLDPQYRCGFICDGQPGWNAPIQAVEFYQRDGPKKPCSLRRAGMTRIGSDDATMFHCDGRVWHAVSIRQVQ